MSEIHHDSVVVRKSGAKHIGKVLHLSPTHPSGVRYARVLWWVAYSARPGHGRWRTTRLDVSALRPSDAKWPPNQGAAS